MQSPGIGGAKAGWGSSVSRLAAPGIGCDCLSWNPVAISAFPPETDQILVRSAPVETGLSVANFSIITA